MLQFPFLVSNFGRANMSNMVKESFGSDFPEIIRKKQVTYLFNYLKDLGAKSIVLETDYVDKDYLEDYSRYYVKCFNKYGARCARLHFFSEELNHTQLDELFKNPYQKDRAEQLNQSYLGFMVVKPIPKTFIGKTCLKIYPIFENGDKPLLSRDYVANLYGLELKVRSIAFQEQDKVLSACATTAIWTSLHAIKTKYIKDIPSSSEITLAAINHIENSSNSFPNNGLTNKQILRALDAQNLRHNLISIASFDSASKDSIWQKILAYLNSGIPIILGTDVYKLSDNRSQKLDGHAVTVLGYDDSDDTKALYLHDDRLGPFARGKIVSVESLNLEAIEGDEDLSNQWCLVLQEKNSEGEWQDPEQFLIPDSLIIPVNKMIRIRADLVINTCQSIYEEYQRTLKQIEDPGYAALKEEPVDYAVKIEELATIWQRAFKSPNIQNRKQILTMNAARFIWTATFRYGGEPAFEILFDATDIPQGNLVTDIIIYNQQKFDLILAPIRRQFEEEGYFYSPDSQDFLGALSAYFKDTEANYFEYLDSEFGELRAPKYLKNDEVSGDTLHIQKHIIHRYDSASLTLEQDLKEKEIKQTEPLIWAISADGALLIGRDGTQTQTGHPTLTGFKPARIAGEIKWHEDAKQWIINAKSGRYSGDYQKQQHYLENALKKFKQCYPTEDERFVIESHEGSA